MDEMNKIQGKRFLLGQENLAATVFVCKAIMINKGVLDGR